MLFYVYIIQSEKDGSYYKGFSLNPVDRLRQHNDGLSHYTSYKCPWRLVFIQSFMSKAEALKREKSLKKYSHAQIIDLLKSDVNEWKG
jgi:putative endonuclease